MPEEEKPKLQLKDKKKKILCALVGVGLTAGFATTLVGGAGAPIGFAIGLGAVAGGYFAYSKREYLKERLGIKTTGVCVLAGTVLGAVSGAALGGISVGLSIATVAGVGAIGAWLLTGSLIGAATGGVMGAIRGWHTDKLAGAVRGAFLGALLGTVAGGIGAAAGPTGFGLTAAAFLLFGGAWRTLKATVKNSKNVAEKHSCMNLTYDEPDEQNLTSAQTSEGKQASNRGGYVQTQDYGETKQVGYAKRNKTRPNAGEANTKMDPSDKDRCEGKGGGWSMGLCDADWGEG